MSIRKVLLAYVCTAFLAAPAAVSGAAVAEDIPSTQLLVRGYQSLVAGETSDAIAFFSDAIEARDLTPDQLANALLNRALAHQKIGENQDAVDDYTAALRIDALGAELRATALYNRGLAYQKLKHPALAIEDFTGALLLDPHFAHAYFSRGTVLRESGQYLFALSDYEKALRFNHPQVYLVHYGMALGQESLKRPDFAEKSLAKAITANPDFQPARQKLAALEGTQPKKVASADAIVTGTITKAQDNQVMRKEALPEPVKPPAALAQAPMVQMAAANTGTDTVLGASAVVAAPRPAKFTDRVPQEEMEAPAKTVKAIAIEKPAKPIGEPPASEVKIVAIEALPDIEPSADAGPAKAAKPVKPAAAKPAATKPAEPVEAEATAQEPASLTGWIVQISSAKDETVAWGTWKKLKAKHDILADQKPVVLRADLGAKGIYYRLRLGGFDSRSDAQGMCSRLKSRGVSCFVSKISS